MYQRQHRLESVGPRRPGSSAVSSVSSRPDARSDFNSNPPATPATASNATTLRNSCPKVVEQCLRVPRFGLFGPTCGQNRPQMIKVRQCSTSIGRFGSTFGHNSPSLKRHRHLWAKIVRFRPRFGQHRPNVAKSGQCVHAQLLDPFALIIP